jgi:hypothetical protein
VADDYGMSIAGVNSGAYYSGRGAEAFPDPFFDMASLAMPQTIPSALRWTEFILSSNGIYRSAIGRAIAYFLTDIQVEGEDISDDEKEDFCNYLRDELHIMEHSFWERMNEACYGNSFYSVIESFTRYCVCKCRFEVTFDAMVNYAGFHHQWANFEMTATCPKCRRRGVWEFRDRRGGVDGDLIIKSWSPHEIQIIWDHFTHRTAYIWMIPADYRRNITQGMPDVLKYAPKEVIEAVKSNSYIRFGDGVLWHGMTRTFAGIRNRGWGIPRVLTNFRQAWYVQVLHRFNEAIALDYVMPIRVLTPDSRGGASPETSDPLLSLGMGNFGSQVDTMMRDHRRDPGSMHWLPYPVKYQALGGEASQMAPFQLLDQGQDTLLNSCDIPVELYKMNLSMQAAPPALRLFESVHRHVPHNVNRFLAFIMKKVAHFKDWPQATASLIPVTILDDLSKQMPKLQLMPSGQVSPQTALSTLGLKAKEEFEKNLDFQRFQAEKTEEMQEAMQEAGIQQQLAVPPAMQLAQQQGGQGDPSQGGPAGMPPSAQPGAAGAFATQMPMQDSVPTDPREVLARAQNIAAQLLPLSEGERASRLRQLKQNQPLLHDAVSDALKDARSQAARQGRDQVLAQQFGKAGDHYGLIALRRRIMS